mgnify:CR=1 FL=1
MKLYLSSFRLGVDGVADDRDACAGWEEADQVLGVVAEAEGSGYFNLTAHGDINFLTEKLRHHGLFAAKIIIHGQACHWPD